MKTIFNYINTLAENSQSPLNFLTSYHLAAIHYLFATLQFIRLCWGMILRYYWQIIKSVSIISSSVALKCLFPLGGLPNLHVKCLSHSFTSTPWHLHVFILGVYTGLSQPHHPMCGQVAERGEGGLFLPAV